MKKCSTIEIWADETVSDYKECIDDVFKTMQGHEFCCDGTIEVKVVSTETLKKQIAESPIEIHGFTGDIEWLCPSCKSKVGDCVDVDNYCKHCGQKILFN